MSLKLDIQDFISSAKDLNLNSNIKNYLTKVKFSPGLNSDFKYKYLYFNSDNFKPEYLNKITDLHDVTILTDKFIDINLPNIVYSIELNSNNKDLLIKLFKLNFNIEIRADDLNKLIKTLEYAKSNNYIIKRIKLDSKLKDYADYIFKKYKIPVCNYVCDKCNLCSCNRI